jgi:hypothetical protein
MILWWNPAIIPGQFILAIAVIDTPRFLSVLTYAGIKALGRTGTTVLEKH